MKLICLNTRYLILGYLWEHPQAIHNPKEIKEYLKTQGIKIDRSNIYRHVKKIKEEGWIETISPAVRERIVREATKRLMEEWIKQGKDIYFWESDPKTRKLKLVKKAPLTEEEMEEWLNTGEHCCN